MQLSNLSYIYVNGPKENAFDYTGYPEMPMLNFQISNTLRDMPCVDIDECTQSNPCKNNGTCINLLGGFECRCPAGYQGDDCSKGKLL